MDLKIIMYAPYPHGMASTVRIHNYAKGIAEAGGKVQVLVPRPTERYLDTARNTDIRGVYEAVDFEYTCGTTARPDSFIKRRLLEIRGILRAGRILVRDRKEIDAVLLVTNHCLSILYFALLCKALGLLYLQEKSEMPFFSRVPRNIFERVYQYLYKQHIYKLFDGILVISHSLYEYFQTRMRKTAKLLLVPIIVDPEEFLNQEKNSQQLSIALCGALTESKDGVLTLIRAFKRISDKFNNLTLYLIGGTVGHKDEVQSRQLVRELCLESRVVFTGYVSKERLRSLMCNASVLALAKPSNLQADHCFPSKLAEYLATGNPVVVTNTGEIPLYLQDGVNAFITEPDSDAAFARKLDFALSNPELAQEVGQRGRELALDTFNYRIHSRRIMKFIQGLKSKRS